MTRQTLPDTALGRSRSFYEHTLGLSVYREYGAAGVVTGVVFFLGGGYLEVTTGPEATVGDVVKLWMQVADVAAEEVRLRQAGVTVKKTTGRMPWGWTSCGSGTLTESRSGWLRFRGIIHSGGEWSETALISDMVTWRDAA